MPTVTNRYGRNCLQCKQWVEPGDGSATKVGNIWRVTHTTCPQGKPATKLYASGPPRNTGAVNKRAGECLRCGGWVPAAQGDLVKCCPDSSCMEHFDSDNGGWHAQHHTLEECATAKATAKVEREKKVAAAAAAKVALLERAAKYEKLVADSTVGLTPSFCSPLGTANATTETVLGQIGEPGKSGFKMLYRRSDGIIREYHYEYDNDLQDKLWIPPEQHAQIVRDSVNARVTEGAKLKSEYAWTLEKHIAEAKQWLVLNGGKGYHGEADQKIIAEMGA